MKNYILATALLLGGTIGLSLGKQRPLVTVGDYSIKRVGTLVEATVSLTSPKNCRSSYKITAMPALVKGTHAAGMPDVVFRTTKGRILDFRHNVTYPESTIFAEPGESVQYTYTFPYKKWMNHSELLINIRRAGCAKKGVTSIVAAQHLNLPPDTAYVVRLALAYQQPAAEKKARAEIGSAFLEFPVGKSKLTGDFANNAFELGKINNSITLVSSDRDNKTLEGVEIWGTCSPEGSSASNARLAQNRALAVRDYIMGNYPYATSQFAVTSTPENWAGLAKLLENSTESWAPEVVEIAKSDITDNAKDKLVRTLDRGATYRTLLTEYYPQLRRVDYRVNYSIRDFTPSEVVEIYKTRPQDLSLAELYTLSQSYTPGTHAFSQIMQTAATLYPQNSTANLNAATAALQNGNYEAAAQYLSKVEKTSPYLFNTLGALQLVSGNYQSALESLKQAKAAGLEQAAENLKQLGMKVRNLEILKSQK